ncbi:MAG TPA: NifU family protein [Solirubrobacteraceae bacterium]|nr:NifU family protein [Solirubrobacteraceae bacterium]
MRSEDGPERLVERVQELQAALDSAADAGTRELADELVSAIVQMYGAGLERVVGTLLSAGTDGERLAASLTDDPLVATLLLIHDLHPVPLEDRVQAALDSVRPYMESHGGNVELLGLENGIARIHLRGSCSDCSASSVTLELAIKQALEDAAPDLAGLEVEGVAPQTVGGVGLPMATGSARPTGMELPVVMSGPPAAPSWFEVASVGELLDGTVVPVAVAGAPLAIANVDGTLLAYRDTCAGCGGSIHDGELRAGALMCRHCERSFFLPRAGRSLDDSELQLEPVPLLRENGHVKVALAG